MRSRWRWLILGSVVIFLSGTLAEAGETCKGCDEARSLLEAGKCKEAIPLLKKADKANKESVEAHGLQVVCYLEIDKRKNAARALETFLELGPSVDDIRWVRSAVVGFELPTPSVEGRFGLPQGVEPPVLLLFHRPVPSQEAKAVHAAGDVVIEGILQADGTLGELEANRSGDWSRQVTFRFGETAIESMIGWRYFPALKDGKPFAVEFKAIVRFRP